MSMRFLPSELGVGCAKPTEKETMKRKVKIRRDLFNMVVIFGQLSVR